MLNAAWLMVHLIASATALPEAAAAAQAGVSCTYQACMAKCTRLTPTICHSYCEARVSQRVAQGICVRTDAECEDPQIGN